MQTKTNSRDRFGHMNRNFFLNDTAYNDDSNTSAICLATTKKHVNANEKLLLWQSVK